MTRRDEGVRVRHMLDHAREAVEMADGRDRADLDTDRQFSLAMVRLMEIVGEAAARVPDSFRQEHPQVPWRDIADLRNRLIHGYDLVDHDTLWDIIQLDLPPLIAELERMLQAGGQDV
jgi:uncharacterized protein with HEPN domain